MSNNPPPPTTRPNQRRYERSAIDLPVVVTDAVNKVEGHIELTTQDVSAGGAFVRSDLLFEVGEEFVLAFELPSGRTIKARGRVVRVARELGDEGGVPGMGIQFVDLSDADREAILALTSR